MSIKLSLAIALVLMTPLTPAMANFSIESSSRLQTEFLKSKSEEMSENSRFQMRTLSDHPGAATALTQRQKSEIRSFLAKSPNLKVLACTGTSLEGQRDSMYRVVRLRASLVCEYASSLNPQLLTNQKLKITKAISYNGRVIILGK